MTEEREFDSAAWLVVLLVMALLLVVVPNSDTHGATESLDDGGWPDAIAFLIVLGVGVAGAIVRYRDPARARDRVPGRARRRRAARAR